jgi:hypothetical protein
MMGPGKRQLVLAVATAKDSETASRFWKRENFEGAFQE